MVIKCKVFEKNISKKGFELSQGGKHKKYIFYYNGIKTHIIAEVSHNSDELRPQMISMLTKQLMFDNKSDLLKLKDIKTNQRLKIKHCILIWLKDKNYN